MNEIKSLFELDWKTLLFMVAVVLMAFVVMIKTVDFLLQRFGIETRATREKREQKEEIQSLHDQYDTLSEKYSTNAKKSEDNDAKIIEAITALSGTVAELKNQMSCLQNDMNDIHEKDQSSKRADLKDKIGQWYRVYHEKQEWSQMDKERLEDLIKSYEMNGGKNSFVHSIVEPEMHTWKLLD